MGFAWDVKVDGSNVAAITLEGASINYGRRSLFEQPAPPIAVVTLLTEDAVPLVGFRYPEFGLGDHSMPSGFVDAYSDTYEGPLSRITIGAPLVISAGSESGFTDDYRDAYEGVEAPRFTGVIGAIDYRADTITLTGQTQLERWARINVGGTDGTGIPAETDVARVQRLCAEAGVTIVIDGPSTQMLIPVAPNTSPDTLTNWLFRIATDTGGLLYADRLGVVHYETHDPARPTRPATVLPPEVTLVDPLLMQLELGAVRNRVTVFYGVEDSATNVRPSVVVSDQASIDAIGVRDYVTETILNDQGDATARGSWLLSVLSPGWTMPDAVAALGVATLPQVASVALLEQGSPVHMPQFLNGSPVTSFDAVVLGYTETLSDTDWQITLHLTPNTENETVRF